jgi:hypothetical protein
MKYTRNIWNLLPVLKIITVIKDMTVRTRNKNRFDLIICFFYIILFYLMTSYIKLSS